MKSTKLTNIILHPQELTPPKDYPSFDAPDTKALKIKCFVYWKKHRFPNCCDFHRQRVLNKNLDITAWDNSDEHLFKAITYTLFFIKKSTRDAAGLDGIKKYIASMLFSFGTHSPIVNKYVEWTVAILNNQRSNNDSDFLKPIIDFLESPNKAKKGTFEQLTEAEQAFHKWLGSLPENLFSEEMQQNLSLIFFRGIIKSLVEVDEFNSVRRLELNSVDQFLEYLTETTTLILDEIWRSIGQGDLDETLKEASIIDRNKTTAGIILNFKNYSDQEKNYLTIIHDWGEIVSGFMDREIERRKLLTNQLPAQKGLDVVTVTKKHKQSVVSSFPELFRKTGINENKHYDNFIQLLLDKGLIDPHLNWLGDNSSEFIGIFWALKELLNGFFLCSEATNNSLYTKLVYAHFNFNQDKTGWKFNTFRRPSKHLKAIKHTEKWASELNKTFKI